MNKTLPFNLFKIVAFFILLFVTYGLNAQNIIWQKTIGGSNSDVASCVKPTSDGGFILCGYSKSNTSGDKSENNQDTTLATYDFWIVKLDATGNIQWENTIGGSSDDRVGDIIETYNGGFLIGGSSSSDSSGDKSEDGCNTYINYGDYWVVKINSSGVIEWQNTIGACGGERLRSIDITSDGGYLLGGTSDSNISCDKTEINTAGINGGGYPGCGGGTSDYWIVKIDSIGNIICQKTLGRGAWAGDYLTSVASASDGGFICVGWSYGPYASGYGGYDNWIVKLNSNCTVQWQKVIGGSANEQSGVIKQLADGNYICGGTSSSDSSGLKTEPSFGLSDFWILKLDTVGNIIWQKTIGGSGDDYLNYIFPTFDNGFICGGYSNSPISGLKTSANFGQNDYWILKLDSVGNIQWQRTIGGRGNDVLSNISQMPNGNYFGGGYSSSNISGNKTENSKGDYDYWVFKLDDASDYNLITGKTFYDYNGNNVKDSSDIYLPYKIIKETNTNRFTFSKADGTYRLAVSDTGTYTVTQQNPFYLSTTPSFHNTTFTGMNQIDSLNDFATQQTIFINDLQITITPVGAFRPGFNATYNIHYKNVGTNPIQGTIVFYPDSGLTYISSTVLPLSASTDSIVWRAPILYPFNESNITVTVHVKSTTGLGYWINSSVKIEPLMNDQNPKDNFASWRHLTSGSVDPNDILVDKDSITTDELITSPYLDYIVRFQNTGSDTAFNVKILNPIDTFKFDLMSIEIISSSHIFSLNYLSLEGNLEFKFDDILLPDSNINEPESHGFVRYRIHPKTYLAVHDSVTNYAAIYFDYNLPVITNTALTRIVYPGNFVEIFTTVCDSLISPSGNYTWTSTGLYFDTIPGGGIAMDSVYAINLNVGTSYGYFNAVSCENYTSPSGNYIWTSSGIYSDTLINIAGCDSIVTINLTIIYPSISTLLINECISYQSPSGNYTWTISGTYYDTIPNVHGCDSILIIDLTIYNQSDSAITTSACDNYISPSGNYVWTTSGSYTDTLSNIFGCDSLITINLTINSVDISVTANPPLLFANAAGANYQWIYCDSVIIQGELNQVFLATANGSYAVKIVQNGCIDTSICYSVYNVGMNEHIYSNDFYISPNPSSNNLIVYFGSIISKGYIIISNTLGESVYAQSIFNDSKKEINIENISPGIYFVKVFDGEKSYGKKLIVE